MKFNTARMGIALLAAVLAGCTERPPQPPPVSIPGEVDIDVLSSDYSVSRFWGCGWSGGCPRKTWTYCLRVAARTQDSAVLWYRRMHSVEFHHAEQGTADVYAKLLVSDEVELANAASETVRAEKLARVEDLRRSIATYRRFAGELDALRAGDPGLRHTIFRQLKPGVRIEAWYTIHGAGTDKQNESGYFYRTGCGQN